MYPNFMYNEYIYMCIWVCSYECSCLWKPIKQKDTGFPRAGVTNGGKLPDISDGK